MYYAKVYINGANEKYVDYVQFEDQHVITQVTENLIKLAEKYVISSYGKCKIKITDTKIMSNKISDSYVIEVNYIYFNDKARGVRRGMHVYGTIEYLTEEEYIEQALLG